MLTEPLACHNDGCPDVPRTEGWAAGKKRLRIEGDEACGSGVEEDLRALHGSLTQLNALRESSSPAPDHGGARRAAETEERATAATLPVVSPEEARAIAQSRRLHRLRQLPPHCVPLHAELAEGGMDAATRACAAVMASRAKAMTAAWVSLLSSASSSSR